MEKRLTCAEARQMDLVDYLETLGYQPQKIRGAEYWYLSPLRTERNASFKVDRRLNRWYDHGMGQGGTLIDFGILYYRCTVGELLTRLTQNPSPAFSLRPPLPLAAPHPLQGEGKLKIVSAGDITSGSLKQYLATRGIEESTAALYCKEVCFTLYGKAHTAIGFPNNSGGFELRNAYFKGSAAPKALTLLDYHQRRVCVFEGFFSFLSFLQLNPGRKLPAANFLILNSLTQLGKATGLMEQHRRVHLYLDRDASGFKATSHLLTLGLRYTDKSGLYRYCNDLNDYLVQRRQAVTPALRRGRSL